MNKKLKVIIEKTHKKLGEKGSVIQVNQGYAFNYLIPKKIVKVANKGQLKHLKMLKSIENIKLQEEYSKASIIQSKITRIVKINIMKKLGDKQQIFGRISEKDIVAEIFNSTGELIDKKQIELPDIKTIGVYNITVQLADDIYNTLKLYVLPSNIETIL